MTDAQDFVTIFTKRAFVLSHAVALECVALADKHNVTVEDFCKFYELFALEKDFDGDVTPETVEKFTDYLLQEIAKATITPKAEKQPKPGTLTDRTNLRVAPPVVEVQRRKEQTSPQTQSKPSTATPETSTKQRPETGTIVSSLHATLRLDPTPQWLDHSLEPTAYIEQLSNQQDKHSKYMQDTLPSKANFVNRRILMKEEQLEAANNCSIRPVNRACQEEAVFVGRICCDSEGKLNERSVLLEGSIENSDGQRVRLDLSTLPQYRLFPGQVVAVKGLNSSGHCLLAMEVDSSLSVHLPTTTANISLDEPMGANSQLPEPRAQSILVASGPFTTADNMQYEALDAILGHCAERKADVLMLLGPFVDQDHQLVASGMLDETYDDVFQHKVLDRLQRHMVQYSNLHVVLIPSTRDVHHHPVLPQQAMDIQHHSMHSMTNPATWRCDSVVFGCTTTDVIRHLAAQEIHGGSTGERMVALSSLIMEQGSFYPLQPPAPGTPLDTSLGTALDMPLLPHFLLLPSDLGPFAKLVQLPHMPSCDTAQSRSVVCINPGRAARGSSLGACAWIQVQPVPAAAGQVQGEQAGGSTAAELQCQVDLIRV